MNKSYFLKRAGIIFLISAVLPTVNINAQNIPTKGWTPDNGNGTFTNPLFFEDTPDPTMIRVGEDYYLTCSSMHFMPGLPIMHSKDLVNWELINYAFPRINPGPEYSFQEGIHGKDGYGKGIWAPSFVYHDGVYYIFANINNHGTQVFKTTDPRGEWEHYEMKRGFHDMSVMFDDDGKAYICWGYKDVELAQLNEDLTDIIPSTRKVITNDGAEGAHMYKINGKYYIIWSVPGSSTPMLAGVADHPYGPYRVEQICYQNHAGVHHIPGLKKAPLFGDDLFEWWPYDPNSYVTMHQGGIIDTSTGEWWGYVMQDHSSLGRCTNLSPVTWEDDIPYFGLPGNLTKTPKTWIKPDVGLPQQPIRTLVQRDDDFSSPELGIQWQWNHIPDDTKWSLTENPGKLRLNSLPSPNFWTARNTLTQRAVGLESDGYVDLDISGLQPGDVAGMAMLIYPYAWIGVEKTENNVFLKMFNQKHHPATAAVDSITLSPEQTSVTLKIHTDVDNGSAGFAYSTDGRNNFIGLGDKLPLHFQLYTFRGPSYALFNYNNKGNAGGYADFDNFVLDEMYPKGLRKDIPYGQKIALNSCKLNTPLSFMGASEWLVEELPLGRVALKNGDSYLSINADDNYNASLVTQTEPTIAETFQWMELEGGNLVLMSVLNNYYLSFQGNDRVLARIKYPRSNRKEDFTRFEWSIIK